MQNIELRQILRFCRHAYTCYSRYLRTLERVAQVMTAATGYSGTLPDPVRDRILAARRPGLLRRLRRAEEAHKDSGWATSHITRQIFRLAPGHHVKSAGPLEWMISATESFGYRDKVTLRLLNPYGKPGAPDGPVWVLSYDAHTASRRGRLDELLAVAHAWTTKRATELKALDALNAANQARKVTLGEKLSAALASLQKAGVVYHSAPAAFWALGPGDRTADRYEVCVSYHTQDVTVQGRRSAAFVEPTTVAEITEKLKTLFIATNG